MNFLILVNSTRRYVYKKIIRNMMLSKLVMINFISRMQMVHPLLDQSFFLDNTHKMRLKEEFSKYTRVLSCIVIVHN